MNIGVRCDSVNVKKFNTEGSVVTIFVSCDEPSTWERELKEAGFSTSYQDGKIKSCFIGGVKCLCYLCERRIRKVYDDGVAITTEYVLLLGISLFIFSAIYIGFNSFYNTSASDSRAQSAAMIATYVSDHISDLSSGDEAAEENIDLPDTINGDGYVVYPSTGRTRHLRDDRS